MTSQIAQLGPQLEQNPLLRVLEPKQAVQVPVMPQLEHPAGQKIHYRPLTPRKKPGEHWMQFSKEFTGIPYLAHPSISAFVDPKARRTMTTAVVILLKAINYCL